MPQSSFQYSLRHLFIAITLCNVAFFLLVILTHQGGTREQLPAAEKLVLKSIEADGLQLCSQFY